jgi:hypothetical protein
MVSLNVVGLSLSFIAALLLFIYGVHFEGETPKVAMGRNWWRWFCSECGQRLGFILLMLGFLLQLISQFIE